MFSTIPFLQHLKILTMTRKPTAFELGYDIVSSNKQLLLKFLDLSQTEGEHPLMTYCDVLSKLTDLHVYLLILFFILVFVLCLFSDWFCDNYKDCAAGISVSRKAHTEQVFY